MANMADTEGAEILKDGNYQFFNIKLWGDGTLLMNIPMFFQCEEGEYNSAGALEVKLQDILEEYLAGCQGLDEGEGLVPLANMLREFADKYEQAAVSDAVRNQQLMPSLC